MQHRKSLVVCCLGNILEWYDFGLFALLTPILNELFFPRTNSLFLSMSSMTIFAIGFFFRPIGGFIFGKIGDHFGRAIALRIAVLFITLPSFLIACLPSYQQIGLLAPIALLILRIFQGIGIGGEYTGNMIYLSEIAKSNSQARYTALAAIGANLGALIAALTTYLLTLSSSWQTWAWRLPYFFSGLLGLLIYAARNSLKETPIFTSTTKVQTKHLFQDIWYYKKNILRALGLISFGSTFYYFIFVYLGLFLQKKLSTHGVAHFFSLTLVIMMILIMSLAYLSDRICKKKFLLLNVSAAIVFLLPGFYLLKAENTMWGLFAWFGFITFSAAEQSSTPAVLIRLFPTRFRYTGLALSYNIANGFLGGTIALIASHLDHISFFAPAFYVMLFMLITWYTLANITLEKP